MRRNLDKFKSWQAALWLRFQSSIVLCIAMCTSARGIAVFTFGAQRTNDELQKEKKRRDRVSSLGLARLGELATAPARSIQTEPRGPGWRPTRRPGVSENDWREIEEVS